VTNAVKLLRMAKCEEQGLTADDARAYGDFAKEIGVPEWKLKAAESRPDKVSLSPEAIEKAAIYFGAHPSKQNKAQWLIEKAEAIAANMPVKNGMRIE
jgi:hypothetical protein